MNKNGTKKQGVEVRRKMLAFIEKHTRPVAAVTVREIGEALKISSTSVVAYHLERMERDGEIKRIGNGVIELMSVGMYDELLAQFEKIFESKKMNDGWDAFADLWSWVAKQNKRKVKHGG